MDPDRWQRLEALFLQAVELPPDERGAWLEGACAGDAELRERLHAMLEEDARATGRLARPIEHAAAEAQTAGAALQSGQSVGPYRIERELGRGGMGTVYLAARADDQYRKRVAVKVATGASLSEDVRRRFRAEREILARLEHPNIARLLDAGTTGEGLPYVVMEHVEGLPIDEYCDRRRLETTERLALFRQVCAAVQYAHRSLVIHRDLKPSNSLVGEDGTPKLLDFGIAKLLDTETTGDVSPLTRTAMRLLTPDYASPEQVRGEPVTTASDVYSLGVLLYELLTGRRPYRLDPARSSEVERVVCEVEPERPSTVVTREPEAAGERSTRTAAEIGAARGSAPGRLRRAFAGDLDTIVLVALRKDPARRYASPDRLAEDIRRHLEGLPVLARPDTWRYRAGKYVRRHRFGVAAAVALFLATAGFVVTMALQARRIARERDTAEQVTGFLVELFQVSDPEKARGETITAREVLDRGAGRLRTELGERPSVQARLLDTIGTVYRNLGLNDRAGPLLEEALAVRRRLHGEEHPEVADSLASLGMLRAEQGNLAVADELYTRALELRRRLHPKPHADLVESLGIFGGLRVLQGRLDEAETFNREALAMARAVHGERHEAVATCLNNLGLVLSTKAKWDEAESVITQSLELRLALFGEVHPDVAASYDSLGTLFEDRGQLDAAVEPLRRCVELRRKIFGEDNVRTALAENNLSGLFKQRGEVAEAEALQAKALETFRAALGPEHLFVATALNNLGNLRHDQGDRAGAEKLHREALALLRKTFGDAHPRLADSLNNLGTLLWDGGDYAGAEPLFQEALEIDRKLLGAEHPYVAMDLKNLGMVRREQGDYSRAEPLLVEAIELSRKAEGDGAANTARYEGELGYLWVLDGRPAKAESLLRGVVAKLEAALPAEHWEIDSFRSTLGDCLRRQGRFEEAERLLTGSYTALVEKRGAGTGDAGRARRRVADLYRATGRPEKARALEPGG